MQSPAADQADTIYWNNRKKKHEYKCVSENKELKKDEV